MKLELRKSFKFESAHFLPFVPETHKCRRLHGHSYVVEIAVCGEFDTQSGWVMDYGDITSAFRPILEDLDHHFLNAVPGLSNPTSENLAVWIWNRLQPQLPLLSEVSISETCTARCVYNGSSRRA